MRNGIFTLRTAQPVIHDSNRRNHRNGSFILVDPGTNETLAAGMIVRKWLRHLGRKPPNRQGPTTLPPRKRASRSRRFCSF